MVEQGTAVFRDAVELLAMGLDIELDEIRCVTDFAQTTATVSLGSWSIEAGCVAGVAGSWQGIRDGRPVVEANFRWRKGRTLDPDWKVENAWIVEVDGWPCVRNKTQIFPGTDHITRGFRDYGDLAMVVTAMPAIHAIPYVVAADPGIVTYLNLPAQAARGFVTKPATPAGDGR
jgi:4-hydroxy-tetrahydrodipicolinate reductase